VVIAYPVLHGANAFLKQPSVHSRMEGSMVWLSTLRVVSLFGDPGEKIQSRINYEGGGGLEITKEVHTLSIVYVRILTR